MPNFLLDYEFFQNFGDKDTENKTKQKIENRKISWEIFVEIIPEKTSRAWRKS